MAERLIRNLPDSVLNELEQMGKKAGYKSTNEFLVAVLTSVAMGNFFEEKELRYQSLLHYVAESLENATAVIEALNK